MFDDVPMADPVIANGIRAHVILPGVSDLPEDRFVTTWAATYTDPTTYAAAADDFAAALVVFFTALSGTQVTALWDYMGPHISTATDACEVRTYDLEDPPEGREPTIVPFTWSDTDQDPLPAEVAVVNSFHGTPRSRRNTGRVYIGPLNQIAGEESGGDLRPADVLRSDLVQASLGLVGASGFTWGVLSPTLAAITPVAGGFIDNAFDTQRRRGLDATTRNVWSVP